MDEYHDGGGKKKHNYNEKTNNSLREVIVNPLCVKFGMFGMRLPPKCLYVQIWPSNFLVNEDGWMSIMVEEVKKKHTNNEGTYKVFKAVKSVKAPFAILAIPLQHKLLYVQIWGSELLVNEGGWTIIMVKEVKKKHANNERTYKKVKECKPVKVPFVKLVIELLSKYLYVHIPGEKNLDK